jgi:hypothetical protein
MGMKPRKRPVRIPTPAIIEDASNCVEHDHPAVRTLCRAVPSIADNPATLVEAMAWVMALVIDELVPEGDTDAAVDDLRNEIMVKTCMLKTFHEEKAEPLWDWISEGLNEADKGMN